MRKIEIIDRLDATLWLENDETYGIEIKGDNINYSIQEIGKNFNTGEMTSMEGLQLNNYKNEEEIRVLCREIADRLKILQKKLKE